MFTNPQKNIERLQILPGMKVADLGSGPGEYSLPASLMVGESGRVYAIDVQKEILSDLKFRARERHLSNLEVIWGDVEKVGGTRLADNSIDIAIASNILFQVQDKETFLSEVHRILKEGGRVFLIDWLDSFGGLGPEEKSVISPEKAKELFARQGFVLDRVFSDIGDHHYGLVFKKSDTNPRMGTNDTNNVL